MIENLRKYTGLIFIVIVTLLIGFTFMDTQSFFSSSGAGEGGTRFTIGGKKYSHAEFVDIGAAPLRLAQGLQSFDANGLEIMRFTNLLTQGAGGGNDAEAQFFVARTVMRSAANKMGIYPSDEAVKNFILGLSIFQETPSMGADPGTQGKFDQLKYNNFVQKSLKYMGLSEQAFQELVRDVIASTQLREVVGGGLGGSPALAKDIVLGNDQRITADLAVIDTKAIREGIAPSDEELKKYWETAKEKYMTETRLKITYLLTGPQYPEELAGEDPPPAAEETPEQKTAREAEQAGKAEQRKKIEKDFATGLNEYYEKLTAAEGKGFEKLTEDAGWKTVSTDWVTPTTLPAELTEPTRGASAGKTVASELLNLKPGPDPLAPFTLPLAVGKHNWLVARLDASEEPRVKTFEEAREEVEQDYRAEKAAEIVGKEIEEKIEELKKALAGGQSFAEAAKEAGLEARVIGPFSASDNLVTEPQAREIFQAAATVKPGDFGEAIHAEDTATLIHVISREIVKSDARVSQIDEQISRLEVQNENAAFMAWLNKQIELARPVDLAARS